MALVFSLVRLSSWSKMASPCPSGHTRCPEPGQQEQSMHAKCVIGAEEGAVAILSHQVRT